MCKSLKSVTFNEGLEALGTDEDQKTGGAQCGVFEESAVEDVELPSTLKSIGSRAFLNCPNLKTLWLADGFEVDLKNQITSFALILPSRQTHIGYRLLWNLRELKQVVIPDGVEKIGSYWFAGSQIESVQIAASVREICSYAFSGSKNLAKVTFADGGRLEKIGTGCFQDTACAEITIPSTVTFIGNHALDSSTFKQVIV